MEIALMIIIVVTVSIILIVTFFNMAARLSKLIKLLQQILKKLSDIEYEVSAGSQEKIGQDEEKDTISSSTPIDKAPNKKSIANQFLDKVRDFESKF